MEPAGFGIGHVSMRTGRPTLKTRKSDAMSERDICGPVWRMIVENIYTPCVKRKSCGYATKIRGTLSEMKQVTS